MKIDLYLQSGEKKGTVEANDKIFAAPVNHELMRLALLRQLSNSRQANAHTKTRGEVRGGGKKPYKQKHTGRARQGSTRSPVWPGGGIAFGPRSNRNYTKQLPKQAVRSALFSALSLKAADKSVLALDKFESKEPKVKDFVALLKKLPVQRSVLVVEDSRNVSLEKSAQNLPNVEVVLVDYLNLHDLLNHEKIVFLSAALKKAEELYLK